LIHYLDQLPLDLLRHLGVTVMHLPSVDKQGFLRDEIHIFSDPKHLNHVRGFVARYQLGPTVRVFEGSPPPF